MSAHVVDVYVVDNDEGDDTWCWECWTCGADDEDFVMKADAEKSAENHRIEEAAEELIANEELP